MRKSTLPLVLVIVSMSTAFAAAPPSESGAEFVKKAVVGNTFEIEEAKLALAQATDPRLKDFAHRMIADHGAALKMLDDAAGKAKLARPQATLDPAHQAMLDNLKTFTSQDFDKIYIADQIQSHVETMALLSDYKQNGKNRELKGWAETSLPVVKGHLASIDAM